MSELKLDFPALDRIINRPFLVILCQGISSGIPAALIASTLQAWFAVSGIDIVSIGTLSLVGQPYAYKFLWAPLLDHFSLPFLGHRRGWIFVTQLALICGIVSFAFFNPAHNALVLGIIALLVAFIAASQDIVLDAYRTEFFAERERDCGISIAFYTYGYRIATLIAGGGALILADHIGWPAMYGLMAVFMLLLALITLFLTTEPDSSKNSESITPAQESTLSASSKYSSNHKLISPALTMPPRTIKQAVFEPLQDFWQRPGISFIFLFVILYKLTDALALSLGSKFLIDLGFSLTTIGTIYKGVGLIATLCGTVCAGILMIRISLFAALLWFGVLQSLANLTFSWLALVGHNSYVLAIAVFSENFCSALGTVAFLTFLMRLCHRQYTATQYAILSAFAMVGRIYIGPLAGNLAQSLHVAVNHTNWAAFYFLAFLAAIPSFILLGYLKRKKIFQT